VVGLLLFAYSAQLSHNSLFYYLCGITIGVTTSFLIIILFISRFIPKVCILSMFLFVVSILLLLCFLHLETIDDWLLRNQLYVESLCCSNVG